MEFFSNSQLIFLSILLFVGGEAFTFMLGLLLMRAKIQHKRAADNQMTDSHSSAHSSDHIELAVVVDHPKDEESKRSDADAGEDLKVRCVKILGYLVICYVLVVHIVSFAVVSIYFILVPSAREVLESKGLGINLFSAFSAVSTFSNSSFMPTNENMMVFKKNSGLLLILIPQVLMGNTLYPVCLRSFIRFMEKMTKRSEFK
ncbi:UNVERIFIED_CONTAM: putative cation transporter HKT6 [Sesamum radiatum]|uniref:Cation transporter HKT6 n=1 Tax=Sesamum radiatum TaxID=300843 RepID=A0AAW2KQ90_SESRA